MKHKLFHFDDKNQGFEEKFIFHLHKNALICLLMAVKKNI